MTTISRKTVAGTIAGGIMLLAGMTCLAAAAIATGLISVPAGGNIDLGPWLILELAGGVPIAYISGVVARRVGRSRRSALSLAGLILLLGSAEAAILLLSDLFAAGSAMGILVLVAPPVTSACVLAGGLTGGIPGEEPGGPAGGKAGVLLRRLITGAGGGALWRLVPPALVLAAGATVGAVGFVGVEDSFRERIVASALAIDLMLVLPLLVYVLFVRAGRAPLLSVVPAALAGTVVTALSIPEEHGVILEYARWLIVPAEIALLAVVAARARRSFLRHPREGDFTIRFRAAAIEVIGSRVPAEILTTEIAILRYAFGRRVQRAADPRVFTMHKKAGYAAVLGGIGMAIVVETVAVHVLVRQFSAVGAWVLSSLSLYALLWLVGDFRALLSRPLRILPSHLEFRLGLRWEADIPLTLIAAVSREEPVRNISRISAAGDRAEGSADSVSADEPGDAFDAILIGSPNVRIEFTRPVELTGMYGLRKTIRRLSLRLDDPDRFIRMLSES